MSLYVCLGILDILFDSVSLCLLGFLSGSVSLCLLGRITIVTSNVKLLAAITKCNIRVQDKKREQIIRLGGEVGVNVRGTAHSFLSNFFHEKYRKILFKNYSISSKCCRNLAKSCQVTHTRNMLA